MASPTLRFLKALSDPTRLRLLMLVAAEELNVAELGEILSLPQPTVSRHVAALREAGLLRDRRDGPFVYCTSNTAALPAEPIHGCGGACSSGEAEAEREAEAAPA